MIYLPSLNLSPSACVFFTLSDPAKSTNCSLQRQKSFLKQIDKMRCQKTTDPAVRRCVCVLGEGGISELFFITL